jgi:hypothetical protein
MKGEPNPGQRPIRIKQIPMPSGSLTGCGMNGGTYPGQRPGYQWVKYRSL